MIKEITNEQLDKFIIEAVADNLTSVITNKKPGHCLLITDLHDVLLSLLCQELRKRITGDGFEIFLVSDKPQQDYEISPTKLIEYRNSSNIAVLVALLPTSLKSKTAEDSYAEHTFEIYDPLPVIKSSIHSLVTEIQQKGLTGIDKIIRNARLNTPEAVIRYLLSFKENELNYEIAGAFLYEIGLIPQLDLSETKLSSDLVFNNNIVDIITNAEEPLHKRIERLDLEPNSIQVALKKLFSSHVPQDVCSWGRKIINDIINDPAKDKSKFMTLENWPFKDKLPSGAEDILEVLPLDPKQYPKDAAGDHIVKVSQNLKLRWIFKTNDTDRLHHFNIKGVRDEEELFVSKKSVRQKRHSLSPTANIKLKNRVTEEGSCKVIIAAMDEKNRILAEDETDPFWINVDDEGLVTEEPAGKVKFGTPVFSIWEAYLQYALSKECSAKKIEDIIPKEITWKSSKKKSPPDILRIKFSNKEIYYIRINPVLKDTEEILLENPNIISCWEMSSPYNPTKTLQYKKNCEDWNESANYRLFMSARKKIFAAIKEQNDQDDKLVTIVDNADLSALIDDINDYTNAYTELLLEVKSKEDKAKLELLLTIDTVNIKLPAINENSKPVLLMSPLHPLKLQWYLQYQLLFKNWCTQILNDKKNKKIDLKEVNRKLRSLHYPAFIPSDDVLYTNIDQLTFYWSIFYSTHGNIRNIIGMLKRCLNIASDETGLSGITSNDIYLKIYKYLAQHQYIHTLKLNVINPGDGQIILEVLRELQKSLPQLGIDIKFDIRFFGSGRMDQIAYCFDDYMAKENEGLIKEHDEDLLEASKNPLFPKLSFAKHSIKDFIEADDNKFKSHLTIIIDYFSSEIKSTSHQPETSTSFVYGLLNDLATHFNTENEIYWERTACFNALGNSTFSGSQENLLKQLYDGYMQSLNLCYASDESLNTALILHLDTDTRRLISQAHTISDWVMTIDKNFGIEYLDHPSNILCEFYLIDYSPEYLGNVGHRLIISTASYNELEKILMPEMVNFGLDNAGMDVIEMLDILKSLSGKLVLKLLSTPNKAKEAISLALARLLFQTNGDLCNSILIPLDAHYDLYADNYNQIDMTQEVSLNRTDILKIDIVDENNLTFNLIEVKCRFGLTAADYFSMQNKIDVQLKNSENMLNNQFINLGPNHLHKALQYKKLVNIIEFYLYRALRHSLVDAAEIDKLKKITENILSENINIKVTKQGLVFHLDSNGFTEDTTPDGNKIKRLGKDKILELIQAGSSIKAVDKESSEEDKPEAKENTPDFEPGKEKIVAAKPTLSDTVIDLVAEDEKPDDEEVLDSEEIEKDVSGKSKDITIYVGKSLDDGSDVNWEPGKRDPKRLANQHFLILGKSGTGKTQSTMAIIHELWNDKIPSLIFDFHGEYTDTSSGQFRTLTDANVIEVTNGIPINPLELPVDHFSGKTIDYKRIVWEMSEIIAKIFKLGIQQKRALKRGIEGAYQKKGFGRDSNTWDNEPPQFMDIYDVLQERESVEGSVITSLLSRLESVFDIDIFTENADFSFEDLISQVTVLRLSNLYTEEHKLVVAQFIMQRLYNYMLAKGQTNDLRLFMVIDEAHKLSFDETLTKLIKEIRKYGIGIILSSQEPADFHQSIFENTGTFIVLQLGSIQSVKAITKYTGLQILKESTQIEKMILNQDVGEAIIKSAHHEPFVPTKIKLFYERVSK